MADPDDGGVSCRRCKHYRVSWDPHAPHACTAMGFKSEQLPCLVVYEASGLECQMFEAKASSTTRQSNPRRA